MKTKIAIVAVIAGMLSAPAAYSGNEDRVGSAGATELLINPWARSSSWGSAGVSSVTGIEATWMNVAGLAFTPKTELNFTRSNWMTSSGIKINSLGLAQRMSETSVLGLTIMSMTFGDIPITTEDIPEGGIGDFSPRYFNIGLSFAKEFSRRIYGGLTVKALSEAISNARSSGVAFDAGIRYVSGENDQVKFGITLKNVGPPMTYTGDGFSVFSTLATGSSITTEHRTARFEMPSLVNIGASYDFLFNEKQKLTLAGAFTSNSFSKDQWRIGADFGMVTKKTAINLRAGYVYEAGILGDDTRSTAFTGPSLGFSVDYISGEDKSRIGIDYGYRFSNPFGGTHSIGIRIEVK
jgi:hypothetical protein